MTRCACGLPLHYAAPTIEALVQRSVDRLGPDVPVSAPEGTWLVPRHYLALHHVSTRNLAGLATQYRWDRIGDARPELYPDDQYLAKVDAMLADVRAAMAASKSDLNPKESGGGDDDYDQ